MQVLIYIGIAETVWVSYEPDLVQWAKSTFPDIVILNLDNHSDALMTQHCLGLMKEANQLLVLFDNPDHCEASLGAIIKVLQAVTHQKFQYQSIKVMLMGKHTVIEKMGKVLDEDKFIQTTSLVDVKKEVSIFFNEC